jgi:hypothetical protein
MQEDETVSVKVRQSRNGTGVSQVSFETPAA